MSASPSPTPPEPIKVLSRINPPQIIEIACPEELEAAQRPPTNKSGEEVVPTNSGIQSTAPRYFLMSNISVIVSNGHNRIKPARKDIFKTAMEPFFDIVKPTLTFGDRASEIPIEIHAIQDHGVWTAEELHCFLVEGKAPKPHDSKHWAELLGTYYFAERIFVKSLQTFSSPRRSAVRFFVNNALLCYTPESQGSTKDSPSQAQASELVVLSLNVSTGPQAMLDHAKSMTAHASGGTYILRQNPPVGTNRNALMQTGVNALVGGAVSGLFGL